jgi:hypothetical protein
MIKFFRRIRQNLLSEGKTAKYFKYALGEIILVVIGILIAIQINNTNQKRLDKDTLDGYLKSIAQNIESDLRRAEKINEIRKELFPRISFARRRMTNEYFQLRTEVYQEQFPPNYRYSVENIDFVSKAINETWYTRYLTPNLSGFESLKNSGFLSQLQGSDLEKLLFDYYNQMEDLTVTENNYNASINNAYEDFLSAGLTGTFAFFNAGTQDWRSELGNSFEERMNEVMEHPTMLPIFLWPYELIIKYDNIIITGNVLKQMLLNGESTFSEEALDELAHVYDEYGEAPYPKVLRSGHSTEGYDQAIASAINNEGVNLQFLGTHTAIQFKDEPWAVAYFFVGSGVPDPNRVKDFSKFKTLKLKLRGVEGGEQIEVALKDISNPIDGSETKVQLTLGKEWKVYEIPLTSFAPTSLEELFIATSFITENQALTIEVESIEFQ